MADLNCNSSTVVAKQTESENKAFVNVTFGFEDVDKKEKVPQPADLRQKHNHIEGEDESEEEEDEDGGAGEEDGGDEKSSADVASNQSEKSFNEKDCNCSHPDHYSDTSEDPRYYSDYELDESYGDKLKWLEEEQEQLNTSLIALTSHFAQVQLRLKQIMDASAEEKEDLLKSLEEFAFRGIPDLRQPNIEWHLDETGTNMVERSDQRLELQRAKQKELIVKLKEQLEDLEKYAYETGDSTIIPSGMLLERQTVIIEQLKGKIPLNLDELDKLTPEDLRKQVDKAIRNLVNPVIMKEQLVGQLKTQVSDLERFIEFLQDGGAPLKNGHERSKCTCNCPLHGNAQKGLQKYDEFAAEEQKKRYRRKGKNKNGKQSSSPSQFPVDDEDKETLFRIIKRVITLLQMFTFAQFGCNAGSQRFDRNMLKKTPKGNHYGDLRARLELAVNHILEINKEKSFNDSDYTSDGEDAPVVLYNETMITTVRKEFAIALRDLIEHGLIDSVTNSVGFSLIPHQLLAFGCFSTRSAEISSGTTMTAWDLIMRYYQLKNGPLYNSTTARRLSQSYNLSIVGGTATTPKQTLLSTIDLIIQTHTSLKRSPDSHFKAFVSHALNEKKLVTWLRLILKNHQIINAYYEPWSYVALTGFEDAFKTLDKLTAVKFKLPTDIAIRQLQNINDAF